MNEKIRKIAIVVFICVAVIVSVYLDRDYEQYSANIPYVSWAIETENYSQALEKLEKIANPDVCMTAATAYCLYKTDDKNAAIRLVKDYLANKDVSEHDRDFLSTFIDAISEDNISTFTLEYKKNNDSSKKNIEYSIHYR